MMRIGYADLGVRAPGDLTTHHQRSHARQVCLVRECQEVEHQASVFIHRSWNPGRLGDDWKLAVALCLGHLDSPLDIADGVEILVQLGLVA